MVEEGRPYVPTLFVLCIEYFTRVMQQEFAFPTKCKGLRLNHMCFADNMLLFCKGEFQSILLILRGLRTFSDSSGLLTCVMKSNKFIGNMENHVVEDLFELTGYTKGELPFRYLSVPITAKRLSVFDCEMIVDKMAANVKPWGSRNSSYIGRV